MKATKEELIHEAKYLRGESSKIARARKPTRTRLKQLAIEEGVLLAIEERTALKRALRAKRKKFNEGADTCELVQLALKNKIKLDAIW
jgi:hypothetical protein